MLRIPRTGPAFAAQAGASLGQTFPHAALVEHRKNVGPGHEQ